MKKIKLITSVLSLFLSLEAFGTDFSQTEEEQSSSYNYTPFLSYGPDEEKQFWQTLSTQTGISTLPAVAIFQSNGQELRYICAEHSIGISSPTYCLIFQTIQEFKPSCLILESFDNRNETIMGIEESFPSSDLEHCGEMIYAAYLAKTNDIPFKGGEPLDQKILKSLLAQGYEEYDFVYFYFTRIIPQEVRQKKLSSAKELPEYFNVYMEQYLPFIQNDKYTYEKYQSWLSDIFGEPLPFERISTDSMLVAPSATGHKLQKISLAVNILRDNELLTRIFDTLKDYNKILVIDGASHYFTQYKVLREKLGNPTYYSY